jgi:hypothetical protein
MVNKITIGMVNKLAKKHKLHVSGPTKCTMQGFGERVGWHCWAFETGSGPDRMLFHFWPTKKAVLKAMYDALNNLD